MRNGTRRWRGDPRTGVLVLVALMLASSAALWAGPLDGWSAPLVSPRVPWWVLLPLFVVAEVVVLNIQVRREAQAISLNEIPLVLGLLLATPVELLVASVVGSALVFVFHRRHSPLKSVFNTALQVFGVTFMLVVVRLGAGAEPQLGVRLAVAAVVAVVAASALTALLVLAVVALHEGGVSVRAMGEELFSYPLISPAMSCVGLITVLVLHADARAAALLVVLGAGLVAAYRAHTSLTERHVNLTRMYDYGRALAEGGDLDAVVRSVLSGARDILRAECAEVVLVGGEGGGAERFVLARGSDCPTREALAGGHPAIWRDVLEGRGPLLIPRGRRRGAARLAPLGHDEAVVVPLRDEAETFGTLMVAERLGEVRTFRDSDVDALTAVANQAGLALRNGRLVERLRHDALHDPLTGLANRAHLHAELDAALARARAGTGPGVAVVLVDLDGFKEVNDSLGHHSGDLLLRHVADRLAAAVPAATVARLGGDEFAVLLDGVDDPGAAGEATRGLERSMSSVVVLDGVEVTVRGSLGVALSGRGPGTAHRAALLRAADEAMYRAKGSGGGVAVHERRAPSGVRHTKLEFLADLRHALEGPADGRGGEGGVGIHVQPIARADSGEIVGAEALLRWDHPRLGLLGPSDVLPLASRHGLLHDVTGAVLEAAVRAAAGWARAGLDLSVSVNVSPRTLLDPRTPDLVAAALARHALPPSRLVLEITEEAVMEDPPRAIEMLTALRAAGVRISIDDFGTGYSSLSYLGRLPADEVKIDQSFVSALGGAPENLTIVRSIIDLGRNLSLDVVAEGVEAQPTWERLSSLGAGGIQGWALARPMPVAGLAPWLAGYRTHQRQAPPALAVPAPRRLRAVR